MYLMLPLARYRTEIGESTKLAWMYLNWQRRHSLKIPAECIGWPGSTLMYCPTFSDPFENRAIQSLPEDFPMCWYSSSLYFMAVHNSQLAGSVTRLLVLGPLVGLLRSGLSVRSPQVCVPLVRLLVLNSYYFHSQHLTELHWPLAAVVWSSQPEYLKGPSH